jgi:hypothetical protein
MRKMNVALIGMAVSMLLTNAPAFAGNPEIDKLVKQCEIRSAQRGVSGKICACTPKKLNEFGFTDNEILKYAKPGYKPKGAIELDRYYNYTIKVQLMAGQCRM